MNSVESILKAYKVSRSLDSLDSFDKTKPSRPFELSETVKTFKIGMISKNRGVDLGKVSLIKGFKKRRLTIGFDLVVVLLPIDNQAYYLEFIIYLDG